MNRTVRQESPRQARIRPLHRRRDGPGLRHLAGHIGFIAASGLAVTLARDSLWLLPALFVHGTLLVFLFAPLHETIHRTAFRSRWLNEAVAHAAGFVLILPPRYFRAFHFAHHRFTQDAARDPEAPGPVLPSRAAYLWRLTGVPYWISAVSVLAGHAIGRVPEAFVTDRARPGIVSEARIYLVLYAAVLLVPGVAGTAWLYWLAPVLLGQPMLRLFLMAEHGGLPLVPEMLVNSRSIDSNAAIRALGWNMSYHAEHHGWPGVPWHSLPALRHEVEDNLQNRTSGYIAVHRDLWRKAGRPV
ncbi:fatty acid desaturase [Oceanibacterium hippocampi]|uniref:Fatty acid desaturase n=1 Tax=Oceanibacterium hippocampi TaxID=745714 RepID=A0A1Y5TPV1_9PROT|nr:fatty acid desaturase [Oceanibacterium hippocampi]SLN68762.1 Fatty acid desaturase [Oceanibacterium hippocampi]